MHAQLADLLSTQDVERELGIAPRTQRTWRSLNLHGWADLTVRIGRRVFYRREDLAAWLEAQKCKTQK